ncbi:hypothetical protein ASPTUDRAFT_212249 [Aspergillus tubingensis CBS 134.48]|uniref:Uncharacterized protein n=1 Tax=Aspergillus tubingensis (strain CBS 134.48) TaxID=767770 RepID=A0A1L9NLI1_ASPTC|nr:hypothetical protein ASPTUDRAFT_212249 [Aspergillus tubingensis CBS 134.48]
MELISYDNWNPILINFIMTDHTRHVNQKIITLLYPLLYVLLPSGLLSVQPYMGCCCRTPGLERGNFRRPRGTKTPPLALTQK